VAQRGGAVNARKGGDEELLWGVVRSALASALTDICGCVAAPHLLNEYAVHKACSKAKQGKAEYNRRLPAARQPFPPAYHYVPVRLIHHHRHPTIQLTMYAHVSLPASSTSCISPLRTAAALRNMLALPDPISNRPIPSHPVPGISHRIAAV